MRSLNEVSRCLGHQQTLQPSRLNHRQKFVACSSSTSCQTVASCHSSAPIQALWIPAGIERGIRWQAGRQDCTSKCMRTHRRHTVLLHAVPDGTAAAGHSIQNQHNDSQEESGRAASSDRVFLATKDEDTIAAVVTGVHSSRSSADCNKMCCHCGCNCMVPVWSAAHQPGCCIQQAYTSVLMYSTTAQLKKIILHPFAATTVGFPRAGFWCSTPTPVSFSSQHSTLCSIITPSRAGSISQGSVSIIRVSGTDALKVGLH